MDQLVGSESLLTLLGVGARRRARRLFVVRRQLRPLREVAGTAHRVAELPLDSGEVDVTARVPGAPHRRAHRGRPGRARR